MPEGSIPMTEQGTSRLSSRNAAVTAKTFPLEGISVPFDLLMAEEVGFEPTDAFVGINHFQDGILKPDRPPLLLSIFYVPFTTAQKRVKKI